MTDRHYFPNGTPVPTDEEAYARGYAYGLDWDKPWTPGGPFVVTPGHTRDPVLLAACEQDQRAHDKWHEGFRDARVAAVRS